VLKNAAAGKGFYAAKQQALMTQIERTGSSKLPFAVLLEVLKPCWENAFSPDSNELAWRKAGLREKGGVTARPYWLVLAAEQKNKRRVATPENKKRAISDANLGLLANFAALEAPWKRAALATTQEGDAQGDDDEAAVGGARFTSSDLSQLPCSATSPAAKKLRNFR
jgi:hypothetical protein